MIEHPKRKDYDLSSVRLWWNAGAFLPPQLGAEVEAKLGGTILSGLGASDFRRHHDSGTGRPAGDTVYDRGHGQGRHRSSRSLTITAGKLGSEEVGEIWGAGPSCASGYFRDAEATWQAWTKDGWFKTGDLGKIDDQGNLILVGRKKDLIIRGGQNVYPAEMESILLTHPSVAAVAVVAMPDTVMGEKACAYVQLKEGCSLAFPEMVKFLTDQDIALYKIPERLELIDEMPMVGGGRRSIRRCCRKT